MSAMRKPNKFPIQILNLDRIKVDHSIQSRVATSVMYMKKFSDSMIDGREFPPVVVFWDGKYYWLADGFHRHGAAKRAGFKAIKAEVHEGSKRDAMIHSAGSNIEFSIERTDEDKKKAVFMLLSDDQWFREADSTIAKHCGVHPKTANRYRAEFCSANNLPLPDRIVVQQQGHRIEKPIPRTGGFFRGKKGEKPTCPPTPSLMPTPEEPSPIPVASFTQVLAARAVPLQPDEHPPFTHAIYVTNEELETLRSLP